MTRRSASLARLEARCAPHPSLVKLQEHMVLDSSSGTKRSEYLRYGLRIAQWAEADPATLTEDQVRAFFIEIKREGRYAPNTIRLMTAALRYLFVKVLGRADWRVFSLIHSPDVLRLPVVLTETQVHLLLALTQLPHLLLLWELILGSGLRISEAVSLEISAFRGKGEAVQSIVVLGKGNKERCVPLPPSLYQKLREHWATHRHPRWIFISREDQRRVSQQLPLREGEWHLADSTAQHAMSVIRREPGLPQTMGCHTLRHTYATMSLEAGVNLLQISRYLGHQSLETTQIYLHLTMTSELKAVAAVEANMQRWLKPLAPLAQQSSAQQPSAPKPPAQQLNIKRHATR